MKSDRPWRQIIRRDTTTEEKSSSRGRSFSWSSIEVHRLTLSCGHVQKRRGSTFPKLHTICKDCEAGKAQVPVTVPAGVSEDIPCQPRDPVARALVQNWRADAKGRVCTCDKRDDEGMTMCQACTDMEAQEAACER